MPDTHANFAYSTVATAPSPANSGTSLVVAAGEGAHFPTPPFNATVWPVGSAPIHTNAEIVRVTSINTDTLTITRAQESSSARTILVGDQVAATVTKKTLTDIEAALTGGIGITSQAALDFIYASSSSQLARLAAGSALRYPRINAAGNGWEFGGRHVRAAVLASNKNIMGNALAYPIPLPTNVEINTDLVAHDTNGITCTITKASPCVVTVTPTAEQPAFANGDVVVFTTTGTLPSPLEVYQNYYVANYSGGTFNIQPPSGGGNINTTTDGSGTHSVGAYHRIYLKNTGKYLVEILGQDLYSAGHTWYGWLRLNGSAVANSGVKYDYGLGSGYGEFSYRGMVECTSAGDKLEFMREGVGTFTATAASGSRPACPALTAYIWAV